MLTRSNAVSQWHWVTTPTHVAHPTKPGQHEVWAGAGYLLVWSLLWLAVIVTVLAPLDSLFMGVR